MASSGTLVRRAVCHDNRAKPFCRSSTTKWTLTDISRNQRSCCLCSSSSCDDSTRRESTCMSAGIATSKASCRFVAQQNSSNVTSRKHQFRHFSTLKRRRVVVTGMGAVSPLGPSLGSTWDAILQGPSEKSSSEGGITSLEQALAHQNLSPEDLTRELSWISSLSCQVAGAVLDVPLKDATRNPRYVQLALIAAQQAIQQSNLLHWLNLPNPDENENTNKPSPQIQHRRNQAGVCIGVGMSDVRRFTQSSALLLHSSPRQIRKLSPYFVPSILPNTPSAQLALHYQLRGPNDSPSTACAAGAHAIHNAVRFLQRGDAQIMLAGGTESCVDPLSLHGFAKLRALSSRYNDTPMQASRPFDQHRDGFVMSEGAAVLVLEELNHALDRGVKIWGEVVGCGVSTDAHHVTGPDPTGSGAMRAMHAAIHEASSQEFQANESGEIVGGMLQDTNDICYVNAHATSTPVGDEVEARAVREVFCSHDSRSTPLFVSSTKGATGHLLGAAGALEACLTIQALQKNVVPPTWNLEQLDEKIDSDERCRFVTLADGKVPLSQEGGDVAAMSNSFGFGGTNVSIIFKRYDRESDRENL